MRIQSFHDVGGIRWQGDGQLEKVDDRDHAKWGGEKKQMKLCYWNDSVNEKEVEIFSR